jgi:hypothetical protein
MIYKLKKILTKKRDVGEFEEVFSEYRFKDYTTRQKFEGRFGSKMNFSGVNLISFGLVGMFVFFITQGR